jgi:3',5'-cyclic AMP phosphodiesterase CpdA
MVVSWFTRAPVNRPRVAYGIEPHDMTSEIAAVSRSYTDAVTGEQVHAHHAFLQGLEPDTAYFYEVAHGRRQRLDGDVFHTAPAGRSAFRFTAFGDHGTDASYDPFGSPASAAAVAGVERIDPLLHLALGDLSYANMRTDPVRAWFDWFTMIGPSARRRPWMPLIGNHETEYGNGVLGLAAYQTYFQLPDNGEEAYLSGLWYAFTVGSVRFLMLAGDDVCYQDAGGVYLHGFSSGRQTAWLERTLEQARSAPSIDWVVVGVHQAAVSTSQNHNGADLGLRDQWLPLFDSFGVDLVLCGHEHHYERSLPLRGAVPGSATLTPAPTATSVGNVINTSAGTVYLLLGTGGSSSPSAHALLDPPACRVLVAVVDPPPGGRNRRSVYETEPAIWLGVRDRDHPYAFASFEVRPDGPDATTTMRVAVHDSTAPTAPPIDAFTLVRPSSVGAGH